MKPDYLEDEDSDNIYIPSPAEIEAGKVFLRNRHLDNKAAETGMYQHKERRMLNALRDPPVRVKPLPTVKKLEEPMRLPEGWRE